jgi:small subunit ribosomal protein S1
MARAATMLKETTQPKNTAKDSFASLLEETLGSSASKGLEGSVLKGRVLSVDQDFVTVDVGLKSEGNIPVREFCLPGQKPDVSVGDEIEVYLERMEDRNGNAMLSREKAKREESWGKLERLHLAAERVMGVIYGKVKGGFTVDLSGATAFLPGSQVDIRPVKDIGPLMGTPQPFVILKMDRQRGNIVVSRRAVLEESRAEARSELVSNLKEGQVLQGVVKNITDYGAFVDLGGVDGLLHVTDISWKRINHPSEALKVGEQVTVQVVKFNTETQRISLGMKQLESDPWEAAANKYTVGQKLKGTVTNIADYGAFIELEPGIEGLVHVSEMSWTKKNVHPGKIISTSQEVDVMVLDVDMTKRRISLGLKQCHENPWAAFAGAHKAGDTMQGEIKNITEFGLFVSLPSEPGAEIDGMVHMSDLVWGEDGEDAIKTFTKGQMVTFKVLEIDAEKERVALGIKQLTEDPNPGRTTEMNNVAGGLKKGDVVTCTVTAIDNAGVEVKVGDTDVSGYIKKGDLSRERSEQRPDRFAVGEKLDAKITGIEKGGRKVNLSVKAREIDEDKAAVAEYGSSDSGATLGEILGAAIGKKSDK